MQNDNSSLQPEVSQPQTAPLSPDPSPQTLQILQPGVVTSASATEQAPLPTVFPPSTPHISPPSASTTTAQSNTSTPTKIPAYRSYWIFAAIFLILPPVFGFIILLTGDIYRTDKAGQPQPIKTREKVTLVILAIVFWAYNVFKILHR
ncbi:MAG: hypothetical protein NVSMB46_01820 [Candidatus Saccharimonadales bacterium]